MTTTTVTGEITNPSGVGIPDVTVIAALVSATGAYLADDSAEISSRVTTTTDDDGEWSLVLTPNAEIEPVGTRYRITRLVDGRAWASLATVPVSLTAVTFASIRV